MMKPYARERFGLFHVPGLFYLRGPSGELTSLFGRFSDVLDALLCVSAQEGTD